MYHIQLFHILFFYFSQYSSWRALDGCKSISEDVRTFSTTGNPILRNVFFGHLVTALVGIIFVNLIPLPIFINIAIAVGTGIFFMILLNVVHPPAGGNPVIVIIGSVSYDYLFFPIISGCFIIILLAIIINKFLLKKKYPLK